MANEHTKVIAYVGDNTDVLKKIEQISIANRRLGLQVGQDFTKSAKAAGEGFGSIKETLRFDKEVGEFTKLQGSVQQFSQNVVGADGKTVKFTQTFKENAKGVKTVTNSYRDLEKNTVSLGDNMWRLAKRAALTIPLWLALRAMMTGTLSAIGNSVNNILLFDKAMQKVKQNLSGSTTSIAANMQTLRQEILQTSLELGVSTDTIAEAIKKFASLGFSFEDSLAGGIGATKLATVLFGDAAETADSFARAMNLLIDKSKGAASAQQQMNEMYALAAKLEKTNQFEIKEVNDSLKNFAGTAKSFNLTGKQTLAVLATLGTSLLEGARGGTAASTAFQQMVSHLPDVSKFLNLNVDVKNLPVLDAFILIIEAIEKLNKTDTIAATEAINKLFGGLKAAKPIRALISDLGKLRENLQMTAPLSEFDSRVKDVSNTLFKQAEIFHNLNKEIGKAFLTGLIGGEDFIDTMKIINEQLEKTQLNAEKSGTAFRFALQGPIRGFFAGLSELPKQSSKAQGQIYGQFFDLAKSAQKGLSDGLDKNTITSALEQITKLRSKALDNLNLIDPNFLTNLRIVEEAFKQLEVSSAKVAENNEKTKQSVAATARPEKERQELAEILLKSELEKLKVIGASNSEILKAEKDYIRILQISQEEKDILERKLDLERAINDERKLQSKLGSDSVKLFKIAQENGTDTARKIGEVLSGQMDFATFVRLGGEELEIFKKEFEDLFTQQQAMSFFKGDVVPGDTGLRGGYGIPIEEEAIRRQHDTASVGVAASRANLLPSRTETVVAPTVPVNINANIDISKLQEVKDQFVKEVTNQLPKAGTDLNNALVQALTGKQGTNV